MKTESIQPLKRLLNSLDRMEGKEDRVYEKEIRHIKHLTLGEKHDYLTDRRIFSGVAPGMTHETNRNVFNSLLEECERVGQRPAYGMGSMATLEPCKVDICVGCGKKQLTWDEEKAEAERVAQVEKQRKQERATMAAQIVQTRDELKNVKRDEHEYRIRLNELRTQYDRTEDARKSLQNDLKDVGLFVLSLCMLLYLSLESLDRLLSPNSVLLTTHSPFIPVANLCSFGVFVI